MHNQIQCINLVIYMQLQNKFEKKQKKNKDYFWMMSQNKFLWVQYKDEYAEQLADMFADSMLSNNPFIKPLDLTRKTLYQDFYQQLKARKYKWVLVFVEKEQFERGIIDIAAVSCLSDVHDFLPKGEDSKLTNFNLVPKKSQFRQYMTYKVMQSYFKEFQPKKGEFGYGSSFMVKPQYQRSGVTDLMLQATLKVFYDNGYEFAGGHAINEMAKGVYKRCFIVFDQAIQVEDMYVEDLKSFPLKGTGLSQHIFKADILKSFDKWESKKLLQVEHPGKKLLPRL